MSRNELEALDREIEQKVNGKTKGSIPKPDTCQEKSCDNRGPVGRYLKRKEIIRSIVAVVWVLVCLAAAAAMVLVLYVPAALPWVVNAGVMCFVVAAAIIADRTMRRWTL